MSQNGWIHGCVDAPRQPLNGPPGLTCPCPVDASQIFAPSSIAHPFRSLALRLPLQLHSNAHVRFLLSSSRRVEQNCPSCRESDRSSLVSIQLGNHARISTRSGAIHLKTVTISLSGTTSARRPLYHLRATRLPFSSNRSNLCHPPWCKFHRACRQTRGLASCFQACAVCPRPRSPYQRPHWATLWPAATREKGRRVAPDRAASASMTPSRASV